MGLNLSKGNMYDFITHTFNTIKGECYHDCSYCYMKRWGKLNSVRFDEKELKTDLGKDNFIFVGSSNDMFADNIPDIWIRKTLNYCSEFDNKYFFQTKNPKRLYNFIEYLPKNSAICTTIESNIHYIVNNNAPHPKSRAIWMEAEKFNKFDKYVTVEPIMDFDLKEFVYLLKLTGAKQINIGFDSGNNNLPEPSEEKTMELIKEIEKFTKVVVKKNAKRVLKNI